MESAEIIKKYFSSFNSGDAQGMMGLLDPQVKHETNQGDVRVGLDMFQKFMKHMDECYKEQIKDIVVLSSNESKNRVATEFMVHGEYLKTDAGLPEARNQKYVIRAGSFFELNQGKITRITTYYNLPAWIKAVE